MTTHVISHVARTLYSEVHLHLRMLGKRKFTGAGRSGIGKRRATGFRSSVGVIGAGAGSVRYAGRDWYGSIASLTTDVTGQFGVTGLGLNPLHNTALFERIKEMVKGFAQYRFTKFNVILKGQGGTSKGTISLCFYHNDGKGGDASITNEASVKATGSGFTLRSDQNGIFRCKMDREWLGMDTNAGANKANTSPGILYYFTQSTLAAADTEWDVWLDYIIELKDPVRVPTLD